MPRPSSTQLRWRMAIIVVTGLNLWAAHGGTPAQAADGWIGTWSTAEVGRPVSPLPPAPLLPPTAEDLIAGHKQLIEQAHTRGLKIFGATLTPFYGAAYYTEVGETKRQALNEWIKTGKAYDAVIDFDRVTRDPENPKMFLPLYDSCDHLHPNDAGYRAMADAIDLSLFKQ